MIGTIISSIIAVADGVWYPLDIGSKNRALRRSNGKIPAEKMSLIAAVACFIEANPTPRQARYGGRGKSLSVASVTIPSIPSEPTKSLVRSKPVLFL